VIGGSTSYSAVYQYRTGTETTTVSAVSHYPSHLARKIHQFFSRSRQPLPPLRTLTAIVETAYFASMKCEETRNIICTLAYMNPDDPDPDAPPHIRPQRWTYFRLGERLRLTEHNLVKLSQAAPSYSACVAIFSDKGGTPFIWRLTDQEIHFRTSLDYEAEGHFPRPGIFQIEIVGIGALSVFDDDQLIAGLRQHSLVKGFHDVLHFGPIAKVLEPYIVDFIDRVERAVSRKRVVDRDVVDAGLSEVWISAFCRILLGIRRQEHGGALLLTPARATSGLSAKYQCEYDKLEKALLHYAANAVLEHDAWLTIVQNFLAADAETIPCDLYLEHEVAGEDKDDGTKAILGCISFISSLSRVDGLVLLSGGLKVRGFGVEVTTRSNPTSVYVSHTARATRDSIRRMNFEHFGTRHRSMMRYCNAHPGSLGFVISQDGDIRAICWVRDRLVMWENIKLKNVSLLRPPRTATPAHAGVVSSTSTRIKGS